MKTGPGKPPAHRCYAREGVSRQGETPQSDQGGRGGAEVTAASSHRAAPGDVGRSGFSSKERSGLRTSTECG